MAASGHPDALAQTSIQLFQAWNVPGQYLLVSLPPSPSQSPFPPLPSQHEWHILLGKCSLFCQGDLFNHLIFWWPFIPCYHGYGPIKRRSNKAASQTGNKNIKAMCVSARRGRRPARRNGVCVGGCPRHQRDRGVSARNGKGTGEAGGAVGRTLPNSRKSWGFCFFFSFFLSNREASALPACPYRAPFPSCRHTDGIELQTTLGLCGSERGRLPALYTKVVRVKISKIKQERLFFFSFNTEEGLNSGNRDRRARLFTLPSFLYR